MKNLRNIFLSFFSLVSLQATATPEPTYEVLRKEGPFELRQYAGYTTVSILVEGNIVEAGNKAFRPLFNYISGENSGSTKFEMTAPVGVATKGQKFEMTAPVGQTQVEDNKVKVFFVLPEGVTKATAPAPNDSRLFIEDIPAYKTAVVRYSGRSSLKNYERELEKLRLWMKAQSLITSASPVWAGYDAPWVPWFMRRNEVMLKVE